MKLKDGAYYVVQFGNGERIVCQCINRRAISGGHSIQGWLEPGSDDRIEFDDAKPIYRVSLWRKPK